MILSYITYMLLYMIFLCIYFFLNFPIVIFRYVTDSISKYADSNTKFVDSILYLTVKKVCLPKEMTLKVGAKYCLGKVQNIFVANILGCIIWMYMYGGSAHMKCVKKSSFDNSKVRSDYYDILS